MARRRGQVDEKKSEAILEAAAALFAEKGLSASMEEIARLAGVSKQTVYNRFASKLEIARAMANQKAEAIVAPLRSSGSPLVVLEAFAQGLLTLVCHPDKASSMRGVVLLSADAPELAQTVYEAGPRRSLSLLSAWLAEQTRAGRLNTPNPDEAAEMFTGLVLGHAHLRSMLNVPQIDDERRAHRAREAARIFVTAYAPTLDQAR